MDSIEISVPNLPLLAGRKLLASLAGPTPRGEEHAQRSSPYLKEGTLNSDLAVILAAMVCALICVLGLNTLLRCARCYRFRRMGADGVAIQLANTGLKKAAMKALPIVVYTSASKLAPGLATDCPICLAEFGEGEKVRVLPNCNHVFHMECIDKWLCSHSSCPMCRHSLNLLARNQKHGGAPDVQATESNNALNVVIDTRDRSTREIASRAETLERTPEEAPMEVTTSSLFASVVSSSVI